MATDTDTTLDPTTAQETLDWLARHKADVDADTMAVLRRIASGDADADEDEDEDEDAERVAKLEQTLANLDQARVAVAKQQGGDSERSRQSIRKAQAAVEREYLARMSPQAARNVELRKSEEARVRAGNFGHRG